MPHHTAIQFTGYLKIETAGDYQFHFEMNGGSLRINDKEVVNESPSDRRGIKRLEGSAKLVAGWNPIDLTYFHTGRKPSLKFEMEGPGFPRKAIPSSMLATSDQAIPVVRPLKIDAALVAEGKKHFESLGCAQCHDDIKSPRQEYPKLANSMQVKAASPEQKARRSLPSAPSRRS